MRDTSPAVAVTQASGHKSPRAKKILRLRRLKETGLVAAVQLLLLAALLAAWEYLTSKAALSAFLFGSPSEVAGRLVGLQRRFGVNHLVASVHWPGMPNSLALEQMQILAEEVMPMVRRAN